MRAARTAMMICTVSLFAFWVAAAMGHGNGFLGLVGLFRAAAGVAAVARRFLRRRRYSVYGSELQYAVSVISDGDKWADLEEILGLTVDTEVRQSSIARTFGYRSRDRRAARYIPAIVGNKPTPYGLALTVLSVPGHSRDYWHRRCGQLSSALRVKQVTGLAPM